MSTIEWVIAASIALIVAALIWCAIAHERGPHAGLIVFKTTTYHPPVYVSVGKGIAVPVGGQTTYDITIEEQPSGRRNTWSTDPETYEAAKVGAYFNHDTNELSPR
jgi:hypothetical protein